MICLCEEVIARHSTEVCKDVPAGSGNSSSDTGSRTGRPPSIPQKEISPCVSGHDSSHSNMHAS